MHGTEIVGTFTKPPLPFPKANSLLPLGLVKVPFLTPVTKRDHPGGPVT